MSGFDPKDPINTLTDTQAAISAETLSMQIDRFVRMALKKAISDETVDMFAQLHIEIPALDMNMTIHSPHKRTVEVRFKDEMLGKATFTTRIETSNALAPGSGIRIIHEVTDVFI